MIKQLLFGLTAVLSVTSASAASAADWWLLSRPPVGNSVLFADPGTLEPGPDGSVSLRVLRIDREGRSTETVETIGCGRSDRLSLFACASPEQRDDYGLILASISPVEAAHMLFDMTPIEAERR